MDKNHLDMESMFKDGFDDFSPKPSLEFEKKMAKQIGLASIFGLTFSATITKLIGIAKATAIKTVGSIKTADIIKSIAVVTAVSTTIATLVIIEKVQEAKQKATEQKEALIAQRNTHHSIQKLPNKTLSFLLLNNDTISEDEFSVNILKDSQTRNLQATEHTLFDEDIENLLAMSSNSNPAEQNSEQLTRMLKRNTGPIDKSGTSTNNDKKLPSNPSRKESLKEEAGETLTNSKEEKDAISKSDQDLQNVAEEKPIKSSSDLINNEQSKAENVESGALIKENINLSQNELNNKKAAQKEEREDLVVLGSKELHLLKVGTPFVEFEKRDSLNQPTEFNRNFEERRFMPNYIFSLDVHIMPSLFNNLEPSKAFSNDSIIDFCIKSKEKLSYQFGLDFRLQKKKSPLFINIGAHYQFLNEEINYYFKIEEQGHSDYDTTYNYIINPPYIDTVFRIDSTYAMDSESYTNNKVHTNTYQYLYIPLMLGYEFHDPKKKFDLEFSTGIGMGLDIHNTGYLYNKYGQIVSYSEVQSAPVNWYYLASLGLNIRLQKTTLFIQPNIKYQLNKTRVKNQPIENKYFIYGVKFGLRFKLF